MEILSVKTWQWMLAGVMLGVLFSCILFAVGPQFDGQNRDTIEQGEFENSAMALTKFGVVPYYEARDVLQFHKGQPLLRDVTVHPPLAGDSDQRYWVTGRAFSIGMKPVDPTKVGSLEQRVSEWKPFKYPAKAPYEPGYTVRDEKKISRINTGYQKLRNAQLAELKNALHGETSFPTVVDYLKAVSNLPGAQLSFKVAWWERPVFLWTMPPLAGFLVVGIAWPLTLSSLQSLGMAKPPLKAVPVKAAAAPKPVKPMVGVKPVVVATAAPPPPVPEPDHKEYGGVYYPVVKTTHKEEAAVGKPK